VLRRRSAAAFREEFMRRLPLLLVVVLALLVGVRPPAASAHAVLLGTEPAADAVADRGPGEIVLRFDEAVRPVVLRLIDADGVTVADQTAARVVDGRVELPLARALPPGGYIVTWRVISADSHPVGGSFRFAVGGYPEAWRSGGHRDAERARTASWSIALATARAVFLAGLLAATGAVWFALLVARGDQRAAADAGRLARSTAPLAAAAAGLAIGLQGGLLLGAPPADLLSSAAWTAGLSTPIGKAFLAAATALLLLAAASRGAPGRWAAGWALLAVLPLALAGHAATAEPRLLTAPAVALHAIVAGFWLGSLPPLLVALRSRPGPQAAALLQRFSARAVPAVALLVLAGTALAVVQLGAVAALWQTGYGRVLAAKLLLVAGLLLIALRNKAVLTPALAAGRADAAGRLARNLAIELGLIGLVVVLTAALSFNAPPRTAVAAGEPGHAGGHHQAGSHPGGPAVEQRATVGGVTATLTLTPARAGANTLRLALRDAAGAPVEPLELALRIASAEHGIEAVVRRPLPQGDHHALETADMALPGAWTLRLDVLVTDFDRVTFEFEVALR